MDRVGLIRTPEVDSTKMKYQDKKLERYETTPEKDLEYVLPLQALSDAEEHEGGLL